MTPTLAHSIRLALGFVLTLDLVGSWWALGSVSPLAADETPPASAEAWLERGEALARTQDYAGAVDAFDRAAAASRSAADPRGEALAWLAHGIVLSRSGASVRAESLFHRALERFEAVGDAASAGRTHLQLAGVARARDDLEAVGRHLDRAEALYRDLDDVSGLADVLSRRSVFAAVDGDHGQAVALGRRAARAFEALDAPEASLRRVEALRNVAYGLLHLEEYDQADRLYDEILGVARRFGDRELASNVRCNQAEIERLRGERAASEQTLRRVIASFEELHATSPATPEEKAEALDRQVSAYDRLVRLLVDAGRDDEAFAVVERFHARSLTALLRRRRALVARSPAERARASALHAALGAARLEHAASREPRPELERRLRTLAGALDGLRLDGVGLEGPPSTHRSTDPAVDARAVQAALAQDEALVSYWVSSQRILAWVVSPPGSATSGSATLTTLPIPRARLTATLRAYVDGLASRRRAEDASFTGGEAEHLALGRQLYDWLIKPLPAAARGARRLAIVPDAELHALPFEALVEGCESPAAERPEVIHDAYRHCRYLGLERSVAYGPSAGAFLALRGRVADRAAESSASDPSSARPSSLLAVATDGDDSRFGALARAGDEIEGIVAALGDVPTRSLHGAEASEAAVRREAPRYRILHLAAHGLVDDELPLSSGLVLTPSVDGSDDGLLTAYEVLELELDADLVTLAACRSGDGRLSRGEGIVGLSRAFLVAGADAVLAARWDVDDTVSARFMIELYRGLGEGLERADALRRARRRLAAQTGEVPSVFRTRRISYAHPGYWAAFALVGDR